MYAIKCVRNVLFTNDERVTSRSFVYKTVFKSLKTYLCENNYARYMVIQLFTSASVNSVDIYPYLPPFKPPHTLHRDQFTSLVIGVVFCKEASIYVSKAV